MGKTSDPQGIEKICNEPGAKKPGPWFAGKHFFIFDDIRQVKIPEKGCHETEDGFQNDSHGLTAHEKNMAGVNTTRDASFTCRKFVFIHYGILSSIKIKVKQAHCLIKNPFESGIVASNNNLPEKKYL
ncbi:MAG: hypothetical protein WCL37_05380 [Chrysiogenales bacterium]